MTTTAENTEILIQTNDLPWVKMGEGVDIKVLRVSEETGFWSAIIRMQPGAIFAAHKHLAAADFLILKGKLKYRMGEAGEGAYGYEPTGAVHEVTTCDEETILTFNAFGPSIFYNEDGSVGQILNHETALELMHGTQKEFTAGGAAIAAA
jgi:anti-sigma factor ChrR (cupin superfamily)